MNEKFLELLKTEKVRDLVSKGNNTQIIADFTQWFIGGPVPSYTAICGLYLIYKELDEYFPDFNLLKTWGELQEQWLFSKYRDEVYRVKKTKELNNYIESINNITKPS